MCVWVCERVCAWSLSPSRFFSLTFLLILVISAAPCSSSAGSRLGLPTIYTPTHYSGFATLLFIYHQLFITRTLTNYSNQIIIITFNFYFNLNFFYNSFLILLPYFYHVPEFGYQTPSILHRRQVYLDKSATRHKSCTYSVFPKPAYMLQMFGQMRPIHGRSWPRAPQLVKRVSSNL